jgi:hypothetical protein
VHDCDRGKATAMRANALQCAKLSPRGRG